MIRFLLFIFIAFYGQLSANHTSNHALRPVIFGISAQADTLQVRQLLDSARSKTSKGDLDSAQYYLLQAGNISKKLDFIPGYFEYASEYARLLYRQLRFKEALKVSEEHLEYATRAGNKAMMANAYNNMGVQYHALGDLNRSAESYIQAIKASEGLRDHKNAHKFYSNLSSVFLDLKDQKKSLYYARKGYETACSMRDTARIGNSLVNLSCSEMINKRYNDAKAHLHQLIYIAYSRKNVSLMMDGYINLGEVALLQGEHDVALAWNKKALALLDNNASPDYAIYIYDGIAKSYAKLGQFAKADAYFEKSLRLAETENFTRNELKELYRFGAELKETLNKPQAALTLRKQYDVLKDSILNEATQASVHALELKYQTALKEKKLTQQQLMIAHHESEIQVKNKWIILSVSVLVLFCLGGVIIYLFYRHRQKIAHANKAGLLLQAQISGEEQERARQARELHDGVAGILSAAKLHLRLLKPCPDNEDNKKLYEKVLSLIAHAGNEVRNISHNLAPEVLLQDGLETAIYDFCRRVHHPSLHIECYTIGRIPKLSATLELLMYRIVQESVNNIMKHARASHAIVQVGVVEKKLTLTIEDNGVGFDARNIQSKGLGIQNLVARIESVGGAYEISSAPGKGTMIHLICDVSRYLPVASEQVAEGKSEFGISDGEVAMA